ncbi:MAG TPA: hypothetical protein VFG10_14700 [Saprospiraceae bacterium]|nr:hypothetical protein [Saprospiraceae bacterium]
MKVHHGLFQILGIFQFTDKPGILWSIAITASLFLSCTPYLPVKKMDFFVKDGHNLQPMYNAHVDIVAAGQIKKELTTDLLGHTQVKLKDIKINPDSLDHYSLVWHAERSDNGHNYQVRDSVQLNTYLHTYDLYLIDTIKYPQGTHSLKVDPTADMHYHISMRVHNYFGNWLYPDLQSGHYPSNVDWYKSYKKLTILTTNVNGDPKIRKIRDHFLEGTSNNTLKFLQKNNSSYDKPGSNKLTQYTQATFPHLLEGNVQLAYDAISPFEQATSRTFRNRLAGNLVVTGAAWPWMNKLGQKNNPGNPLTHWKNFNLEYQRITHQDTSFNNFHWRFFNKDIKLEEGKPTIVLVVEGSHILQDTLFPNFVNYNIEKRTLQKNLELLEKIVNLRYPNDSRDDSTLNQLKRSFIKLNIPIESESNNMKNRWLDDQDPYTNILQYLPPGKLDTFIQTTLSDELIRNIKSVKALDPPICMMAISHLAYNGMTGHSVAWDQGGFINNLIARRNYGIRVSNDPSYRKQWEGAFFSVPGVNTFGKLVIDSLISKTNGHRILIDLKHSAPSTRQYFIDSILVQKINTNQQIKDTIYPICSHCGVNGFPRMYGSPFVNEYNITRAPFVHYIYPFAINLYDEEIEQICRYNGIIGIPLEQRILGSYINKLEIRSPKISLHGVEKKNKEQNIQRWNYVKRYLRFLFMTDRPLLEDAISYTVNEMGLDTSRSSHPLKAYKEILEVIYKDYKSAEPFLYNVFHVIDHSNKDRVRAWNHVCIGSDLDGLVDPIDICPTASQYPKFKNRLKQFIPIFLKMRQVMNMDEKSNFRGFDYYFDDSSSTNANSFTLEKALDQLFYKSLFDFTDKRMLK